MPAYCNRILPMLRIPNRQNLLPQLYCTEFSVQKIPTVYSNTIGALFLSSIPVQPLCSSQRELTNFLKISVLCRLFRSISVYCLQGMCIFAKCFFTFSDVPPGTPPGLYFPSHMPYTSAWMPDRNVPSWSEQRACQRRCSKDGPQKSGAGCAV